MEDAFGIVLFGVVIVAAVVAVLTLRGTKDAYRQIGRGGLSMDGDERRTAPEPPPAVSARERDAEVRQMLAARNDRRARQGKAPLDVEAELRRLTAGPAPAADPALRVEVRQLVVARNERRIRRGQAPLDVDAEVERQLRDLQG